MNIILFGGAFDPPQLGHQHIAETLLERKLSDEVWYVPVKIHDFNKKMSSPEHRLAMLKLIIKDPRLKIQQHELEIDRVGYTHETLDFLASKYPQHTFSWIIGSDNLPDFHKWTDGRGNNYLDMLHEYRFYVYPRQGYLMQPLYDNMVPLTGVKQWQYSSTEVREKVRNGESVDDLVNPAVAKYLAKHQLYLS
jgi:nicotinate-nucleotide adenylyltransferase